MMTRERLESCLTLELVIDIATLSLTKKRGFFLRCQDLAGAIESNKSPSLIGQSAVLLVWGLTGHRKGGLFSSEISDNFPSTWLFSGDLDTTWDFSEICFISVEDIVLGKGRGEPGKHGVHSENEQHCTSGLLISLFSQKLTLRTGELINCILVFVRKRKWCLTVRKHIMVICDVYPVQCLIIYLTVR